MKTYTNLWKGLCTYENLYAAYEKARRHKTMNPRVQEFDSNARLNLCILLRELYTKTYKPRPLRKFILRDPKTRTICVSDFRDRVVHHALINVLEPIFEPRFIHHSYASRRGRGTLPAIKQFDSYKRKISKNGRLVPGNKNNNYVKGYVLKCDIQHYFDTVQHQTLLDIIATRVKDENVLWLANVILQHHKTDEQGKGMPLGNWTSQFFANVYLNELDQFVKHQLKAKYYIRYVDDFVILHESKTVLENYLEQIKQKLANLKLTIHPNKCQIIPLGRGISFLGFKIYYHYKTVRRRNKRKIQQKLRKLLIQYEKGEIMPEIILDSLQGWNAYAKHGNTFRMRTILSTSVMKEMKRIAEKKITGAVPTE